MQGLFKFGLLAAAATLGRAAFREGCADAAWDSTTDYFLNKFDGDDNLPFFPTYNNTYVAIKNRQHRYVVLHCTKEAPPRSIVGEEALIVQVPVKNVAALDGFSQNMIEMLGLSTTIKRTGVYSDVTSSCVRGNMMDKVAYDDDNWDKAEEVEVTFYGDTKNSDSKKVLIYNTGLYAPLTQLAYIKFFSMFYGLEELGAKIYDEIASNYRCAAANVQQAILAGDYPKGAFISPVEKDGDKFTVFQSAWWSTLLSDAGSRLVNVSADGQAAAQGKTTPGFVSISANSDANDFAKNSWAIIDTTQYDQIPGKQAPKEAPSAVRVTADTYSARSGASKNIYAVANKNVYLSDKASNRNQRHNFFDRGRARPDLVIRDVISIVSPKLIPSYTNNFIRPASNPDDTIALRRYKNTCAVQGKEIETLNMTSCAMPGWVTGFNSSGVSPNAYGRTDDMESLSVTSSSNGGLSAGKKAGIAVGSIVGFLLVAAAIVFGVFKWRRRAAAAKQKKEREMNQVEKGSMTSD